MLIRELVFIVFIMENNFVANFLFHIPLTNDLKDCLSLEITLLVLTEMNYCLWQQKKPK